MSPCLMTYPVVPVEERANVSVSHDLPCCPSGRKGQCLRVSTDGICEDASLLPPTGTGVSSWAEQRTGCDNYFTDIK
jgi:hypothetical protein